VLVIVASRFDPVAGAAAADWPHAAEVLTSRDLSSPGWTYRPGAAGNTAVIAGHRVAVEDIDGVITRLPAVLESELAHIAVGDRTYVAAEMTAWLAAWLTDLPCPVLNRPSPVHLVGPPWSREQWVLAARRLGVPAVSVPTAQASQERDTVTVVGGRAFGSAGQAGLEAACALARRAGVELLRVHFDGDGGFVDADYWVDPLDPVVRRALIGAVGQA